MHRLDAEWDNVRAAFAHFAAEDRTDDIIRLTIPLFRFTLSRGHTEVIDYARPAIDRSGATPSALLANGLVTAAQTMSLLLRTDPAQMAAKRKYAERALAMARDVGNQHAQARALSVLGESLDIDGNEQAARELAEQAVAIARELGDVQLLAEQLQFLGLVTGDSKERLRIHQESLDCCRRCGDDMLAASELNQLFSLSLRAGRLDEGGAYLEESIGLLEKMGGGLLAYLVRCNLALLRLIQGRHAEAVPLVRGGLLFRRRLGPGVPGGELIFAAACCAAWQGDYSRAASLHGAGDKDIAASLENRSINWPDVEQQLREREQGKLKELLGATAYSDAYSTGAQLSPEQALDLALARDSAN